MPLMDYSNLKSVGKDAKASVESGGFLPLVEGDWKSAFIGAERTMTQGRGGKVKRPMIVTKWKVNAKDNERMHRETLKIRFIMDIDFQIERFLALMIDLNVDLGKVTCDKDWDDVFDELEEARAKALWKVYYNDEDKDEEDVPVKGAYPEYRFVDCIEGLGEDSEYADMDAVEPSEPASIKEEEPEPKPEPAPKPKKTAKPKKKAEPKVEDTPAEEPTLPPVDDEDADSWD